MRQKLATLLLVSQLWSSAVFMAFLVVRNDKT